MPRAPRRKTSDVPTRIYSYRCLAPITEAAAVEHQFKLAHQYRNKLVEIEGALREALRNVQIEDDVVGPVLARYEGAEANVDAAYEDLRARKSGNARADLTQAQKILEAVKELRDSFDAELREAKSSRLAYLQVGYAAAREVAQRQRRAARHDFIQRGLRTATYDRVENAVKQAVASTQRPLHFERYDGTGSIGTQLIGARDASAVRGMPVTALLSGKDSRLRLGSPGEADAHPRVEVVGTSWADYETLPRNVRRHAARTFVDLRVGSNPDRSPIFARFPVTFHRPLPADAVIKWAYVVRRRIGHQYEWRFQVTIESETFRSPATPVGIGTCAIDLGWRRIFNGQGDVVGLRVGYVVDEFGVAREILAPSNLVPGMAKVEDLSSIRDKAFDGARKRLVEWLRTQVELPAWMQERITGLAQWRSPPRLQALIDLWTGIDWDAWRAARAIGRKCNPSDFAVATHRIEGDGSVLAALQAWARQDRQLQSCQEHQRAHLIAARTETWRVVAAELSKRYATILLESGTRKDDLLDLTEIEGWEQPAPEDGNPSEGRDQRKISRLAAPGELRAEILKAAGKHGTRVEVKEAAYSTNECAWCGSRETFDARASIQHRCAACARTWDQDANACRNLLHRHGVPSGPVPMGTCTIS